MARPAQLILMTKKSTKHPARGNKKNQPATTKKRLNKLVNEAVQKVITEYGDVLQRLGKEE